CPVTPGDLPGDPVPLVGQAGTPRSIPGETATGHGRLLYRGEVRRLDAQAAGEVRRLEVRGLQDRLQQVLLAFGGHPGHDHTLLRQHGYGLRMPFAKTDMVS